MAEARHAQRAITRVTGGTREAFEDAVAIERALEIRVDGRPVAVTLCTPGHDLELATGFLAGEGLIRRREDVAAAIERPAACDDQPDAIEITLAPGVRFDWSRLERHFAATSACGLCGKAHLDSLRAGLTPIPVGRPFDPAHLAALPERLRSAQATFLSTGRLHAAALCAGETLEPQVLREDVRRHNADDEVLGWLVAEGRYPAGEGVLWVSG